MKVTLDEVKELGQSSDVLHGLCSSLGMKPLSMLISQAQLQSPFHQLQHSMLA